MAPHNSVERTYPRNKKSSLDQFSRFLSGVLYCIVGCLPRNTHLLVEALYI